MKLWHSFIKELKLAFRGFYIYIEIFMAVLLLAVLLFAVPENFSNKETEYLYLDLPEEVENVYLNKFQDADLDNKATREEIKVSGDIIKAKLYETKDSKIYLLNNKEDLVKLADKKQKIGAIVKMDSEYNINYEYYLQGYESQRLKNLFSIIHVEDSELLENTLNNQDVRPLSTDYKVLTDRENIIPSILTFNGSLMGLFIIAAYIFLDKQEGVIKAYAVTPSSVWQYLISKVGILLVASIISSLIVVVPIMGFKLNYLLLLILLLTTGFFASSLGLLIASFYNNLMQAFGVIYIFMMAMILPNVAYFVPSWNPTWIKVLPTYPILEGFKEILLNSGNNLYVLKVSLGFFLVGLILFILANNRYKKTLAV